MTKTEIKLAEPRGFCAGVERALLIVETALREGPHPVYVLHEIVHNETVVNDLRARGVIFIEQVSEAKSGTLIFSAHGVGCTVESEAAKQPVKVIDATCPIVKTLHKRMAEYSNAGREIILFGSQGHREVEGLLGRVTTPVHVIESPEALQEFLKTADRSKKYACLSQTTQNAVDVAEMRALLQKELPELSVSADVCFATRDRQDAVRELAAECDLILVVGSEKSSNTRRLVETARQCGARAYLLPDASKLNPALLDGAEKIGITSGASAPESLVQELVKRIQKSTVLQNLCRIPFEIKRKNAIVES